MIPVTISGVNVDDPVDRMVELSARFPFLEWGILLSASRGGKDPRYPSVPSVRSILTQGLPLSGHYCGSLSAAIQSGAESFMSLQARLGHVQPHDGFRRVQINGYVAGSVSRLPFVRRRGGFEYVLQAHDELMVAVCCLDAERAPVRCSILFDPSGGRGVEWSGRWPRALPGVRVGYAGGLGPGNVAQVIARIREANDGVPPAWVDMESGVRDSSDRLDLGAVQAVLEAVEALNAEKAQ